jgi:hypothetical protein
VLLLLEVVRCFSFFIANVYLLKWCTSPSYNIQVLELGVWNVT